MSQRKKYREMLSVRNVNRLKREIKRVFGDDARVVTGPEKQDPQYGTALVCEESDREPGHLFLGTVRVTHPGLAAPRIVGKHLSRPEVFELREQLSNWLARQSEPRLRLGV